jgi:hypothetical protein
MLNVPTVTVGLPPGGMTFVGLAGVNVTLQLVGANGVLTVTPLSVTDVGFDAGFATTRNAEMLGPFGNKVPAAVAVPGMVMLTLPAGALPEPLPWAEK